MNLRYDILTFDEAFAFQITYQSPKVREVLAQLGGTFKAHNGWSIRVSEYPEIQQDNRTIYLRGIDASKDLRVDRTYGLSSNFQRNLFVNAIDSALKQFINYIDNLEIISGFVVPLGTVVMTEETSKTSSGPNNSDNAKPVIAG